MCKSYKRVTEHDGERYPKPWVLIPVSLFLDSPFSKVNYLLSGSRSLWGRIRGFFFFNMLAVASRDLSLKDQVCLSTSGLQVSELAQIYTEFNPRWDPLRIGRSMAVLLARLPRRWDWGANLSSDGPLPPALPRPLPEASESTSPFTDTSLGTPAL